MKVALFLEKNNLCCINEDIEKKTLEIIIFNMVEDGVDFLSRELISNQGINYLALCLLSNQIKRIFVFDTDEHASILFHKMGIIITTNDQFDYRQLFKDYIP